MGVVICPVALAVGCRKCPIVKVCPVRSVIGDYDERPAAPKATASKPPAPKARETGRRSKRRKA